jgi:hypothetical protein
MDPNNFNIKSSYKSFSKVCYSDEKNPGRMICKEYGDHDGKKVEKEYTKEVSYNKNTINNDYHLNNSTSNSQGSQGVFDMM